MLVQLRDQFKLKPAFAVRFLGVVVMSHGLFILASTLLDQIALHHSARISSIVIDLPLLIGMSLLFIGTQLRRRKHTAWLVAVMAYTFYLGLGATALITHSLPSISWYELAKLLVLPGSLLGMLLLTEKQFFVRSDIQSFRSATRVTAIVLVATLMYGVAGFTLLEESDFHQEITIPAALHYTVDQFELTTGQPIHAYTRRGGIFVDSLSFVSIAALCYVALSLFQPLRGRLANQEHGRERMATILDKYGSPSEDFFKLWPHDKQYFFDQNYSSGLAFHVSRGVALCVGDPAGNAKHFDNLIHEFGVLCFSNGWHPAFIHVEDAHRNLYEKHNFVLQKIGQEAIVDIPDFKNNVAPNKYFRQIGNKFSKQDYTTEMLSPPHHKAVVERLKIISDEWLGQGGRVERGFVMGYFSEGYLQQCQVLVARDAAGTIQGFINKLPAQFDTQEATFDMLRHTKISPGNINDYMMLKFIDSLELDGYNRLNLGLCPLVGFDTDEKVSGLIDVAFKFARTNGDRFYSFSGLHRFKSKYKPEWHDRYIAYQGGVRGFSRATTALVRTMRVKQ